MSPAKYEGGTPACPHLQMAKLDESGDAYWLESVELINGTHIKHADVLAHGEDWMRLQEHDQFNLNGPVWTVRTAHIVRFRLVEG